MMPLHEVPALDTVRETYGISAERPDLPWLGDEAECSGHSWVDTLVWPNLTRHPATLPSCTMKGLRGPRAGVVKSKAEDPLPRRPCCKLVEEMPGVDYFKPRAVPLAALEEIVISVEELEALRLAHMENLYQQEAAERMGVSRATFGRVLDSAHRKVTVALVDGCAVRIKGGAYRIGSAKCEQCPLRNQNALGESSCENCPVQVIRNRGSRCDRP